MWSRSVLNAALLSSTALFLAACDADPGAKVMVNRDVYTGPHALEQCTADWGNVELCSKKLADDETKRLADSQRASGGSGYHGGGIYVFNSGGIYGPAYGSERVASVDGRTVRPSTMKAASTAQFNGLTPGSKPIAFAPARPAMAQRFATARPTAPASRPFVQSVASRSTSVMAGASRASVTSGAISRGGFGATGRGFSGGLG